MIISSLCKTRGQRVVGLNNSDLTTTRCQHSFVISPPLVISW